MPIGRLMDAGLLAIHDLLLSTQPEGAVHDKAECPVCTPITDPEGGSVSDKTFTEEELAAAVAKAVAEAVTPLQAKVAELEAGQQKNETEAAVSAVKAELEAQIAELQGRLDAAVIEAQQAKEAREATEQFWAEAIAAEEERKTRESRRDERLTKLRDEAGFPDEYLKENEERFVAMSDEEFAARLEEYVAQREALTAQSNGGVPSSTALTAARQTTNTKPSGGSVLREVLDLRKQGVDPRRVRT